MESPYFPYGTYSYLLTGRESGLKALCQLFLVKKN